MAVPYTFGNATTSIPLSNLDTNFATAITLGNTAVYLGNTTTSFGNVTLTNLTISSVASTFPNSFLANSSVTINGSSVSLGGSVTITATSTGNLTIGTGLSGTSYNGSANVTIAIDSTVATLTGAQTLTNKTISGANNTLSNIGNGSLSNSSVTIGNTSVSLGGTATTLGNVTLTNVTISNVATTFPNSFLANSTSTLGNATITLGGTTTSVGNLTLTNATISSVSTPITVAQGGTGLVTITSNGLMTGNGTGNVTIISSGSSGNVLTSNGTAWLSTAPSAQVYPGAGIANSTGTAWGTSYTTNGTGTVVALITSPTFVTPTIGVASATSVNKVAITAPATSATLTLADGSTLATSGAFSQTLTATATTAVTLPTSGTIMSSVTALSGAVTGTPSITTYLRGDGSWASVSASAGGSTTQVQYNNAGVLAGITGATTNGTALTLVAPFLGTPASVTLTNATGLPNAGLVNSSITIGGTAIALGASSNALANDITINTVVVGKGGGNDSTSVCVGSSTLPSGNTGTDNNAFGVGTLLANTIGSFGSGFGRAALRFNTSGNYNTAFGANALLYNTTASNNTAVGYQAGYNQVGTSNTFVGYQAGYTGSTGNSRYNVYVGAGAGFTASGEGNTFIGGGNNANGYPAGYQMSSGANNVIIGGFGGNQNSLDIRTLSNYIVLSDGDGNPRAYVDNSAQFNINVNSGTRYTIFLFNNAATTKAQMYWDNSASQLYIQGASGGVYLTNTGTSWTSNSDERLKENLVPIENGLSKVCSLRSVIGNFISDETKKPTPFLIAQDVQAVLPEAVTTSTLKGDETNTEYLGVAYTEVIPLLVAAIKELNAKFDAYVASHP